MPMRLVTRGKLPGPWHCKAFESASKCRASPAALVTQIGGNTKLGYRPWWRRRCQGGFAGYPALHDGRTLCADGAAAHGPQELPARPGVNTALIAHHVPSCLAGDEL